VTRTGNGASRGQAAWKATDTTQYLCTEILDVVTAPAASVQGAVAPARPSPVKRLQRRMGAAGEFSAGATGSAHLWRCAHSTARPVLRLRALHPHASHYAAAITISVQRYSSACDGHRAAGPDSQHRSACNTPPVSPIRNAGSAPLTGHPIPCSRTCRNGRPVRDKARECSAASTCESSTCMRSATS
jgi:hypothetical protein